MKVQNVRIGAKLLNQAHNKENHNAVDKYAGYILKNAKKAIELGKKVKGEEEIIESMKRVVKIYEETYGVIDKIQEIKKGLEYQINSPKKEINEQQVKKDLERISTHFDTLGAGTSVDRSAQLAIQALEVAYNRLDNPGALKLVYFEMGAKEMLPPNAKSVLERYVDNQINLDQAKHEFKEIIDNYKKTIKSLGINPQESKFLFGKFPPKK